MRPRRATIAAAELNNKRSDSPAADRAAISSNSRFDSTQIIPAPIPVLSFRSRRHLRSPQLRQIRFQAPSLTRPIGLAAIRLNKDNRLCRLVSTADSFELFAWSFHTSPTL